MMAGMSGWGRPLRTIVSLLCVFAWDSVVSAQQFQVATPQWRSEGLRLVQFADDGTIHFAGKEDKTFPAGDLISMRRENVRLPEHPRPPYLLLTSGEWIPLDPAQRLTWNDNRVQGAMRGLKAIKENASISIPLVYVALVCLAPPHGEEDGEILLNRLLLSKRRADIFLLKSGDQIEGKVLERGDKTWQIQAGERTVDLELDKLAALAPNPDRLIVPRAKKPYFRISMAEGARIDFASLKFDSEGQVFQGKTLFGAEIRVPLSEVVLLRSKNANAVYLSDLPPARVEVSPVLSVTWPLGRNRTPLGRPLRLADGVHDKGLSMPAGMRVEYDLKEAFHWFDGSVGLDMRDGAKGRAKVEVRLDGKKFALGGPEELASEKAVVDFRLDVRGGRTLSLEVISGSRVGVQPIVNWGSARLVK